PHAGVNPSFGQPVACGSGPGASGWRSLGRAFALFGRGRLGATPLFLRRAGVDGEDDAERAALAQLRLHPDLPAEPLDDEAADVEAEARPRDLEVLVGAHPRELLEELGDLLLGNAEPVIDDLGHHVLGAALAAADGDRAAAPGAPPGAHGQARD